MKRFMPLIVVMLLLVGLCSAALADLPKNQGPDIINLKMGVMVLPFTHAKHIQALKDDCLHCHTGKIGKIEGWGKDTAHKICISCHDLDEKGPVECKQCHRK